MSSLELTWPMPKISVMHATLATVGGSVLLWQLWRLKDKLQAPPVPLSVNYHFTRVCNYSCHFCFHTSKTKMHLPLEDSKKGLMLLQSSGEPFLPEKGKYVGELIKYCKEELNMESVSIVTNGSLVTREWFEKYGSFLDIMAVSCDSFDAETLDKIGRAQRGKGDHLKQMQVIRDLCYEYNVLFKLNTVVTTANLHEDMREHVLKLNPVRWKVFQCLLIDGENAGEDSLRDARDLVISEQDFADFCSRHASVSALVAENNTAMRNSYLILDEQMRFLDNTGGRKKPSGRLLDIGVAAALSQSGFDETTFKERGGIYHWSRQGPSPILQTLSDVADIEDLGGHGTQKPCASCSE